MWTIFRKSVKTGVVTRDITFETEATGFQGPPLIDFAKCTACGSCVNICPAAALRLLGKGEKQELEQELELDTGCCVYCDRCRDICPEKIISASTRYHYATAHKADLLIRGRCGRGR